MRAHVMVIAVHTPFHVWCHTPFSWYHVYSLFCTFEHFWATFDQNWARFESELCIFVIMFSHVLICFLLLSHMGCFTNKDWSRPNKSVVLDDLGGLLVMNGELIMAPGCSTAVMFFVEELSCSFQNQTHIYIYMYTYKYHPMITSNQAEVWYTWTSITKQSCLSTAGSSERQIRVIADIHRLLMMRNISKEYRDQHVKIQIGKSCSQLPIVALPRQFLWACQWSPTSAGVHPRTSRNQQALVTSKAKISHAKINVAVGK